MSCCLLFALVTASGQSRPQSEQPGTPEAVPVQILYLARGGCQQAVIHRKAAEFLLFVVNLSGQAGIQVALHSADGTTQATQQFSGTQRNWVKDLDLKPGTYTLDGVNSKHHCQIVLE
ncbi:MAG: hypothetical protein ABSF64_32755 [Bryobacteraceae bacterium]